MGLLSKHETIAHRLEFAAAPGALFNTFTDPQHGNALFGTKAFAILHGTPGAPGSMMVRAIYETAPLARHVPLLAATPEVQAQLRIALALQPHRVSSEASMGGITQKSEIKFLPQGSGTLMTFDSSYAVPLHLRAFAGGMRSLFSERIIAAFTRLAELSADAPALRRLQQGVLRP